MPGLGDIIDHLASNTTSVSQACLDIDQTTEQAMIGAPLAFLFLAGLTYKVDADFLSGFTIGSFILVVNHLWLQYVAHEKIFDVEFLRTYSVYIPIAAAVLLGAFATLRLGAAVIFGVGLVGWYVFSGQAHIVNGIATGIFVIVFFAGIMFKITQRIARLCVYLVLFGFNFGMAYLAWVMPQPSSPTCFSHKRNNFLICDPSCPDITMEVGDATNLQLAVTFGLPIAAIVAGLGMRWKFLKYKEQRKEDKADAQTLKVVRGAIASGVINTSSSGVPSISNRAGYEQLHPSASS